MEGPERSRVTSWYNIIFKCNRTNTNYRGDGPLITNSFAYDKTISFKRFREIEHFVIISAAGNGFAMIISKSRRQV